MFIGIKIFISMLAALCVFFTFVGVYALDPSLITIGILFAVSIVLVVLEAQNQLTNPFMKG
ncbi:hypothetical protein BEN71_16930 [Acinetobacter wuhouensis]|uniref:Uncharacterized protein n=1 Tax=Acinetobacter wuhouensis TaxID=1879050 RepID=A0A385C7N2_9GAMM|nr:MULTISPECIES: hypothetical protein [Acinetobacter]AXQ23649.1 hypothetical protein BEN71_16930 [Acinetobacter wuhouensis]AYO55755.1 hypothetical protein CDG68_19830 [Acinetobacter wuhouensis]RZG45800.1 hypothetical protein EXU28_11325 [Acinetobacter wuhouensis]RZG70725.1 hypothetical protein EXU29_16165 [Acinetobacter wuhouensis]RZG73599.1 hypothetical protein EXE09_14445 [Acinetobacter sp. WCHAc060025]